MTEAQREFYQTFEKEYGDPIQVMSLVRLRASVAGMESVGLAMPPALKELWCLLILGEKALHFYVHPSESPLAALFRSSSGGRVQKAQHAAIPYERLTEISLPPVKKGFFSALFAKEADVLIVGSAENGTLVRFNAAVSVTHTAFTAALTAKAALLASRRQD